MRFDLSLRVAAIAILVIGTRSGASGQEQRVQMPHSGVLPTLPLAPEQLPRPGETQSQPWRTQPTESEQKPVSSFIDSLKGNDSAMEIVVGQGRLLTLREPLAKEQGVAVIAVGDPSILDFEVLPDQRMLRLSGKRVGITDLSFVTANGESYAFEVHISYDLMLLTAQLKQIFPEALIQLKQLREHIVVEGEARSAEQVAQILRSIDSYLASAQTSNKQSSRRGTAPLPNVGDLSQPNGNEQDPEAIDSEQTNPDDYLENDPATAAALGLAYEAGTRPNTTARIAAPQVINLLRVPGSQQVMLKVTVAELDRGAARQLGVDLTIDGSDGFFQSLISGAEFGGNITAIFGSDFAMYLNALRSNSIATVLAEPNLVTLSGYPAHFQSGGEFPVPSSSQFGGFGGTQFKPFGIQLTFVPYVLDNGNIRLTVEPEVSNVDETLSVNVAGIGTPVPGVRTRNASTTVELKEGQTLAIAGLLSRETSATTARIPLLGDFPLLGTFFRDTTHDVLEQELLVIVTPQIVGGVDAGACIPLPGQEIMEPNDVELYMLGRIEGRTGLPHRSTTNWDDPLRLIRLQQLEKHHLYGPVGFSE